ncbi:zinc-ribbon domain-containing protein [Limosilactobacillus fermentum]|uniref:zinc-ribbon domain-containing protein n=1 Tax=Limosilactobacillus fermentum TaxID=1613 RepID=UPI003B985B8B
MKYCIKCGKPLEKEDQFCVHCGAKQPHIEENSHSIELNDLNGLKGRQRLEVNSNKKRWSMKPYLISIVGLIAIIVIGFAGLQSFNAYKRNHLTPQEITDIGATVVDEHMSGCTVTYSKEDNQLLINASEGSELYDKLADILNDPDILDDPDILNDQDSSGELKTVKNSLKKISAELSPKMPTSLKDVNIILLNPANSNRKLYVASEGKITYDFTKADDW